MNSDVRAMQRSIRNWKLITLATVMSQVGTWFVLTGYSPNISSTAVAQTADKDGERIVERIECRELAIVNRSGEDVVTLSSNIDQGGRLDMSPNGTQKSTVVLQAGSKESELLLASTKGSKMTRFHVTVPEGGSILAIGSERYECIIRGEGVQLARLATDYVRLENEVRPLLSKANRAPEETARMNAIMNRLRSSFVKLGVNPLGGGFMIVCNPLGLHAASLQSTKRNTGGLLLNDVDGNTVRSITAD